VVRGRQTSPKSRDYRVHIGAMTEAGAHSMGCSDSVFFFLTAKRYKLKQKMFSKGRTPNKVRHSLLFVCLGNGKRNSWHKMAAVLATW
jgi:hypothetical protein